MLKRHANLRSGLELDQPWSSATKRVAVVASAAACVVNATLL